MSEPSCELCKDTGVVEEAVFDEHGGEIDVVTRKCSCKLTED